MDPITVEVIRGALVYAAEEMGLALRNASYSPNIKERMDHSCTIFDSEKRLVAQAEHIPVHLGSMAWAVRTGLGSYKGSMEEGDMILLSDPYLSGTHLPDITLISPLFFRGEIVAYAANKAHHSDVGGRAPGSMAADSTELYQEGIIVPPVKFVSKGEINRDLANLIMSNVRTPDVRMGDLRAQMAANILGQRRIAELFERYGVRTVRDAMQEIMNYSERMMRAEISRMPSGVYHAEDYLEDTGTSDEPAKIEVTVTIKDTEMKVDYTGTSPQLDSPMNAVYGVTLSGVYFTLRCITDPTIPVNDGCYRPIHVYAPEGTILNPLRPAPVAGGNVETSQRNADVLMRAFAQIVPGKVCAACQGTMNNVLVGGVNPMTGRLWAFYETLAGGFGGRLGLDGVDAIHSNMTNTMNTPVEAVEPIYPISFLRYEMRRDTGGPGKWRGGVGLERSWILLAPSATLSILAERNKLRPWGLLGGKPGACGEFWIIRANGSRVKLRSKCTVTMMKNEVLVARTPGGGGYGDPYERDPELVLKDVLNGLVSLKAARRDYGVVIYAKRMSIDPRATEKLRGRRKARKLPKS